MLNSQTITLLPKLPVVLFYFAGGPNAVAPKSLNLLHLNSQLVLLRGQAWSNKRP